MPTQRTENREGMPCRKRPRMPNYDYSSPGAYFVTVCTIGGRNLFGTVEGGKVRLNGLGQISNKCWRVLPDHLPDVVVDAHVVMPNHIHGIIWLGVDEAHPRAGHAPPLQKIEGAGPPSPSCMRAEARRNGRTRSTLPAVVGSFKSAVSREIALLGARRQGSVWQRSFFDRAIRSEEELLRVREYISQNPMKWDLDRENVNALHQGVTEPWET